jgi:general secretion pathway protein D
VDTLASKRSSGADKSFGFVHVILCLVFVSLLALPRGRCVKAVYASQQEVDSKPAVQRQRSPAKDQPEKRFIKLDFKNVHILRFIKFIGEVTGKNFVIGQNVKGNVTIVFPTKISVDEAYKVFQSVLEVHGFTTVPAGSLIKIVPSAEARGKSVETQLLR